ncbi:hypothetical protein CHU98_g1453 [Xylaria longipes]|nr:hypothetical protein CHU98_g1453 [Xylaria longipes]
MEVNSTTFWAILPELMGALVDSRWVAIDVEMSGISTGGHFIPPGSTPQAAYQSVKEAAESYQILQIGFTFCKYNNITSEYETRTIECPISPLFPPETGSKALTQTLNRRFTTSVLSYAFLRDHNFSFSKMLDSGVPYLSREEELYVKRRDIQMLGGDPIDISKLNGIRYVFDALAGEEFASKIKQSWIPGGTQNCRIDSLSHNNRQGFGCAPDMSQVEAVFKARSPIIVGHNLFHDLAFIYRTFFGRLPETLDQFLSTIHKLFPRIIDTKYMFLRGQSHQGQVTTNRSLSELYSIYGERQFPFIRSTDNFIEKSENCHHAGHDSALTMTLFLKQAVYIQSFWSQSRSVPETLYGLRESILDEQGEWEKASRRGLARYAPLRPHQVASPARDLLPRIEPPLQDSPSQRLENYSVKEATIMPPWSDAFWREFGNKTRIGNAGVVEFK